MLLVSGQLGGGELVARDAGIERGEPERAPTRQRIGVGLKLGVKRPPASIALMHILGPGDELGGAGSVGDSQPSQRQADAHRGHEGSDRLSTPELGRSSFGVPTLEQQLTEP